MDNEYLAGVCLKAADLIAERGFTKGKMLDPDTKAMCNNGAILRALGVPEEWFADPDAKTLPYVALEAITGIKMAQLLVLREIGVDATATWEYNDAAATTKEDVILLLKRSAEKLRIMENVTVTPFSLCPGGMISFSSTSTA